MGGSSNPNDTTRDRWAITLREQTPDIQLPGACSLLRQSTAWKVLTEIKRIVGLPVSQHQRIAVARFFTVCTQKFRK
jgi:hypothetical protein